MCWCAVKKLLTHCDVSYSRATVHMISTDIARRAVSLQQLSFLSVNPHAQQALLSRDFLTLAETETKRFNFLLSVATWVELELLVGVGVYWQ